MAKLQKTPTGQLVLTIPKRLAELKGWDKGTVVKFRDHGPKSFIIEKEDEKKCGMIIEKF